MTNERNPQDPSVSGLIDADGDAAVKLNGPQAPGRRKLVIGSTTILATLASTSVLGNGGKLGYLCSPSGFMSGNLSSPDAGEYHCGGISPGGWWRNAGGKGQDGNLQDWYDAGCYPFPKNHNTTVGGTTANVYEYYGVPKPVSGATRFSSAFGIAPSGGNMNTSLWQVLDTMQGSVEWHVAAGYLNAKLFANMGPASGIAFYISPATVVDMYQQYRTFGYYQTSGGDQLDADAIKDFFDSTYH